MISALASYNQIRDDYVKVRGVWDGSTTVLTPDAVTGLFLLKLREVEFIISWSQGQIFLIQDIDFDCLGFMYGVSGEAARYWFNKASVLLISIFSHFTGYFRCLSLYTRAHPSSASRETSRTTCFCVSCTSEPMLPRSGGSFTCCLSRKG